MSIDEEMLENLIRASRGEYDPTLAAQLKRTSEALSRACQGVPDDDQVRKARDLAKLLREAGDALTDVQKESNRILEKVGASEAPVAVALRDVAKTMARKARGRYGYV